MASARRTEWLRQRTLRVPFGWRQVCVAPLSYGCRHVEGRSQQRQPSNRRHLYPTHGSSFLSHPFRTVVVMLKERSSRTSRANQVDESVRAVGSVDTPNKAAAVDQGAFGSGGTVDTDTRLGAIEAADAASATVPTDAVEVLVLRRLDAGGLAGLERGELLGVLGDIQRHENQTAGYRIEVLSALDQLDSHGRVPDVSPHVELREATGVSERDARRITRTAQKAREHVQVLQSLSEGDITSAQAEVLCDARVTDDVRAELLTAAVVEDSDQTRRSVYEAECVNETAIQRFKRQREARGAGWRRDHEGMLKLWARFDPRAAAQIEATLEALRSQYWINDKQVRNGRRSPAQRDADVLAYALAGLTNNTADEQAVTRLHNHNRRHANSRDASNRDASNTGATNTVSSSTDSAPRLPPAQISVLIDLDALRQSTDTTGVTDAGIELPSEVVRGLACDAQLIPIILGGPGGSPDVGRARRTVPLGLRRLLIARDGHCQWPDCDQPPSRCDAHHVIHWANGGPTSIDNLVLLCHRHHHQLHEHGHQLVRQPDGTWQTEPGTVEQADQESGVSPTRQSTNPARAP